jgi:hypothetical protein
VTSSRRGGEQGELVDATGLDGLVSEQQHQAHERRCKVLQVRPNVELTMCVRLECFDRRLIRPSSPDDADWGRFEKVVEVASDLNEGG